MRYISICSGIEAASMAWKDMGWEPVAFAEVAPFPNAVLKHYYPDVPNLGDISKVDWTHYANGTIDLVVGGTPCQSFSVAGRHEGLDGASGLVREYFRLLREVRPRWFVWENVPGALSSSKGEDFKALLREWDKCGYHVAWRILNAQFFGVAQRRRRVFVVGNCDDWRGPIKVLFESDCLPGDYPKGYTKRKENRQHIDGMPVPCGIGNTGISHALYACNGNIKEPDKQDFVICPPQAGCVSSKWSKGTGGPAGDECYNLIGIR